VLVTVIMVIYSDMINSNYDNDSYNGATDTRRKISSSNKTITTENE